MNILTKEDAIAAMREGKKVAHMYFTEDEWMTMEEGMIMFEDGVRMPFVEFWKDRTSIEWETDYYLFED